MPFPERKQFRIKDLAKRWDLSEEDVREEILTGHFKHLIVSSHGEIGAFTSHYYIKEYVKPCSSITPSASELAPIVSVHSPLKERHYNIHSIDDFPWPIEESTLYIPLAEVKAFEKEHKIRPDRISSKLKATRNAAQTGSAAVPAPTGYPWVEAAKKIGIDIAKKTPHLNLEKIAEKVHDEMVKRKNAGASDVMGRGNEVPKPETIKRHALKGIKRLANVP